MVLARSGTKFALGPLKEADDDSAELLALNPHWAKLALGKYGNLVDATKAGSKAHQILGVMTALSVNKAERLVP